METNAIILLAFGVILFFAICGALGMYISGERGRSLNKGFIIGLLPLLGHLFLALQSNSNEHLVEEMHSRNLMSYGEYQTKKELAENTK